MTNRRRRRPMPPGRGIVRTRSPFEVAVLALAIALVAAVVGGLLAYGISTGTGPPDLEAELRNTGRPAGDGSQFELIVRNRGGTTAVDVVVEVTAGDARREIVIDAVPKGDSEEVTVVLPSQGNPMARIVSYGEP
jgi:uncharacterized protein (TIGR02588 family)